MFTLNAKECQICAYKKILGNKLFLGLEIANIRANDYLKVERNISMQVEDQVSNDQVDFVLKIHLQHFRERLPTSRC